MKILIILSGLLLLLSCRETKIINTNSCIQKKTVKWQYVMPAHKVGFKIYSGPQYPSQLIGTIPLSQTPAKEYSTNFDICISNYVSITAFDDYGNESPASTITCIGTGCRDVQEKKEPSKLSAPGIEIE